MRSSSDFVVANVVSSVKAGLVTFLEGTDLRILDPFLGKSARTWYCRCFEAP